MYLKVIKPILDFILALILLIILSPLMLIVAIVTAIDLGFPLTNEFREREGKNKKPFVMYKFRTKTLTKDNNPGHYTKVSSFIDKYRLNELPQLLNVLKGDMSLVEPRPFIPNEQLPDGQISAKRYLLKPGITGLAQVEGGRYLTHKQKLEYDIIYYDHVSFWLDLKILLKTATFNFKK